MREDGERKAEREYKRKEEERTEGYLDNPTHASPNKRYDGTRSMPKNCVNKLQKKGRERRRREEKGKEKGEREK